MSSVIPHGTPSGYSYWKCRCDVCTSAKHAKDREYYLRTRVVKPKRVAAYATASERATAWKKANPEKAKANAARHRAKHKEQRNAAALARYYRLMAEDPEAVRARRRDWAKTEKGLLASRADRHRRRGAKPTPEGLAYMAVISGDPCSYCGAPSVETDHITPITQGGGGDWDNLTAACRACNARKNDRTLLGFLLQGVA